MEIATISNSNRYKKQQKRLKPVWQDPPYNYYKLHNPVHTQKLQVQYHYSYNPEKNESKALHYLQQEFNHTLQHYNQGRNRFGKLGRRDKYLIKNKIKGNPLIRFFEKIDQKIVEPVIRGAFETIKCVGREQQFKVGAKKQHKWGYR